MFLGVTHWQNWFVRGVYVHRSSERNLPVPPLVRVQSSETGELSLSLEQTQTTPHSCRSLRHYMLWFDITD